ncbi:MAG: betaine-aldehyde dehydrogenase, partial [Dinoroseobacter sp.]
MEHAFSNGAIYIGGVWAKGRGAAITSTFAAEGVENQTLNGASTEDVELAITRAKIAQSDPVWQGLKAHERAQYLYKISDGITANIDRIAWIQSRDTSK